jgi:superfamily II DNA/RNA helicase
LDKDEMIARILQAEGRGRTIIFTRTKRQADKLSDELKTRGFAAGAIHGDLGQGAREQALRAFRNDKVDVLVATDVAARGIDVTDVTHVINYVCPEDDNTYLHRIGRTGRAGQKGTAVTFVDWEDMPRWSLINKAVGLDIPEPVETYSSSPHLFEDLDIPKGTKGRLPRHRRSKEGLEGEELEDLGGPGGAQSKGGRGRDRRSGGGGSKNRSRSGSADRSAESGGDSAPRAKQEAPAGAGSGQRRRRRRRKVSGSEGGS